jgi:predicted ATP-dependent serine protease
MEMIKSDFTQRAVGCMEGLKPRDFHGDWNVEKAKLRAKLRKFFYSTGKDLSLTEIIACCKSYKRKHGIEFVVIDYDQKIKLESRDEEWRELHKSVVAIESLAKELEMYIIVLAQSNMDGGISGSKRSSFPASQVFMFEKNREDESEILIRAVKNRFGIMNHSVKVDYEPSKAMVREREKFVWTQAKKQKKEFKRSSGNASETTLD